VNFDSTGKFRGYGTSTGHCIPRTVKPEARLSSAARSFIAVQLCNSNWTYSTAMWVMLGI